MPNLHFPRRGALKYWHVIPTGTLVGFELLVSVPLWSSIVSGSNPFPLHFYLFTGEKNRFQKQLLTVMKNIDLNFDLQSVPCTVKNNILKICFQRF
jgi:hypothetical protein